MRLTIRALTYFVEAVEHGSIANAAETLNIAPSAVSSAIDQVENEFDLKLIQRFPAKGIVPTPSGVDMVRRIRRVLEEFDTLLIEGRELGGALSGRLNIGYYAPVAPAFLPRILAPIARNNPAVRLSFQECDNETAQSGLLNGTFDLIVFIAENVRPEISFELLTEAPPYLLVPAGHRLAKRPAVSIDELEGEPLVLLDLPVVREYYQAILEQQGVEARFMASATSTEMVRSLVGAGFGCALLNMRPKADTTYAGDPVSAVPFESGVRPLRLVAGHLGGKQRRLVEDVISACTEYFAQSDAARFTVTANALNS